MCGIHVSISKGDHPIKPTTELRKLICQRGPDHLGCKEFVIPADESESIHLAFTSTVLALRGGHITQQPFVDPTTSSVLCWNGEAWQIGGKSVEGNDGEEIFRLLLEATCAAADKSTAIHAVLTTMSSISGPFAFIYFDKRFDCLYFGRDRLGRRSLLSNMDPISKEVKFASVAEPSENGWTEVEADGLYRLSYSEEDIMDTTVKETLPISNSEYKTYYYSWNTIDGYSGNSVSATGTLNREIPVGEHSLNIDSTAVGELECQLGNSLKLRISNVPRPPAAGTTDSAKIAVLFSGGLDCTVLARMAHDILPLNQQIDLLNVAFENPRVLKAAQNTQLKAAQKQQKEDRDMKSEQQSVKPQDNNETSKISSHRDSGSFYEDCPDRVTGRKAFEELQQVCKGRTWKFVEINIPYTETKSHRDQVKHLIHPHNTEMDLSIAYALYFASRGSGFATTGAGKQEAPYTTTARVLLSGLGADELFAGYTRHATAFNRHSYEGLINELELDVNRLGKRNLGRDDRVISHWGREARFPYLDESFVKWALSLPVFEKCDFGASNEFGEAAAIEPGKKLLRLLAHRLGLVSVAQEKKRAIQFGARTAKMETGRTKGTSLIS